jgi:peptide/nickel transport system substrate-binding protein
MLATRRGGGPSIRAISVALVAVVIASSMSAAAFPGRPTVRRGATDNTLTIGHLFAIDNLNPFIGYSNEAYLFYSLVYDFLFSVGPDGQTYVPNLAVDFGTTPDGGRTWVYEIRQGVKWHDGSAFTADDVAFTINYNIQNFWLLWAYEPYVKQITQCTPQQPTGCGAEVTGPSQVTVHFDRPFAPGRDALALPILQKKQWQNISALKAQYSYPNPTPIGTGPFKADPNIYAQWLNDTPIVLHANPDYHFGAPNVERLVFQHYGDENSMVADLMRGDIDIAMLTAAGYDAVGDARAANAALRNSIEQQEGLTVIQYWIDVGITQINYPGANLRLNPARFDLRVRQAMAHATDKNFILTQFYRGKGVPGTTLISPVSSFWHYEPADEKFDFNITKANEILDAAGYTARDSDGIRRAAQNKTLSVYCSPESLQSFCDTQIEIPKGQRLSFTMVVRAEAPEEKEIARYLQQQWRAIGVDLRGRNSTDITVEAETTAMTPDVYDGQFDTYIWWWSCDADPNYCLSIQSNFTLNGWSDNYFDNKTYNDLYLAQLEALDTDVRREKVHEAQKIDYLAANFIILAYPYFEYAWWTDEFEGWGNMVQEPGRQLGHFWGRNPLLLDLRPKTAGGPIEPQGLPVLPIVIGGVVAVAAIAGVAVWAMRRREARDAIPELPTIPPSQPPPTG